RASYSHRWEREINSASNKTGVSANTLRALICRESKFNERALSRAGAMGLMQLMPVTAKEAAARLKTESISPFEPKHNIILGASHFARLERRFFHRLPLAVAAYNAGASAVSRWENDAEDWVSWIEEIPYKETREYVRAVLRNIEIYNASDKTENAASSFFAGAESRPVFMKRLSSTGNIAGGENNER
ncbi:MAG: lytic transglycosylase domain-containing protein, partial [Synergistes sp.]|nr:lytic transglycosylase domain-containing protein [Synergistes sp.]